MTLSNTFQNDYSWCSSDFKTAGWDKKVEHFADYGLPIL
ncbi:hypothetical protein IMZ48_11825 [Candidatus Bathyarchaeota archaeon]|nr:hypothetical protein [Candidatus Bathyarchaeota archaeon]